MSLWSNPFEDTQHWKCIWKALQKAQMQLVIVQWIQLSHSLTLSAHVASKWNASRISIMIQELQNTTEYHSYFDTWPCPEDVILMLQSYIKFRSWNNCLKYKLHNSKGHWTPLRLDWTVSRILCLQHLHSLISKLCRDVAQEQWHTEPQNHLNITIPQWQTHNVYCSTSPSK